MKSIIAKTFGGLTLTYYFRQFLFAFVLLIGVLYVVKQGGNNLAPSKICYLSICTALYPYSRFIYESVARFIFGAKTSFLTNPFFLLMKPINIIICWVYAVFIAPAGLLFLYCYHSKIGINRSMQSK